MAKINIKSKEATVAADQMVSLQSNVNRYSQQITDVITALKQDGNNSYADLCTKLQSVQDSLINEAAHMSTLEQALRTILTTYANAETNILGLTVTDTHSLEGISADTASFQQILSRLSALLNWEDEDTGGGSSASVSREEEKQHDLYMQNEIFGLLETDKYSQETWANASVEERKDILRSFLGDLSNIYGVKLSSDLNFEAIDDTTRGYYLAGSNKVTINSNYLPRADSYQIMQTLVHEMRHAYQHAAVTDPSSFHVSPETIEQWKNNFVAVNYINYDGTNYSDYVSQPVEWDAKNFARQYSDLAGANPEYRGSWD